MNNNPYSDEAIYDIVTSDDGFVSVWRSNKFVPAGWRKAGFTGTRRDCLSRIESFEHSTPVRQLGASATIYDMFPKQTALHPSRPAIVTDNASISYERLAAITSGIRTILDKTRRGGKHGRRCHAGKIEHLRGIGACDIWIWRILAAT